MVSLNLDETGNRWRLRWRVQVDGRFEREHLHVYVDALDGCKDASERVAQHLFAVIEKAPDISSVSIFWGVETNLLPTSSLAWSLSIKTK